MRRIILAALITSFAVGSAMAQSCESQAVSKEGCGQMNSMCQFVTSLFG